MIAVVVLGCVALAAWLGAVVCAHRAARMRLPWGGPGDGPAWSPDRRRIAASAQVWSMGLGALSAVAVLAALAVAVAS